MSVECPKCGSRYLRPSRPRSFGERIARLRFQDNLRCLDCNTRFPARTFVWEDVRYARCPICHRMDLNGWTGQSYEPPTFMRWMINLGAKRFRCEYCRHNFASFRIRKEIFSFNRWKKRAQRLHEDVTGVATDPTQVEAHEGPVSPESDEGTKRDPEFTDFGTGNSERPFTRRQRHSKAPLPGHGSWPVPSHPHRKPSQTLWACADFQRSRRSPDLHSPSGPFGTLWIKAFNQLHHRKLATRIFCWFFAKLSSALLRSRLPVQRRTRFVSAWLFVP